MGDRDPFRLPSYNPFFNINQLNPADPNATGAVVPPALTGLPVESGTARTPTSQSSAYAYSMQRALEQRLMAHLLNNAAQLQPPAETAGMPPETLQALGALDPTIQQQLGLDPYAFDPNSLTQDSAPLAGEPGLQFDDAHMTLDPNQLAEELGIEGLTGGEQPQITEEVRASATDKARKIHEAVDQGWFGWGTDENDLYSTVAGLTNEEKQVIGDIYQDMYGESLEDSIRGDTSSHAESALVSMLKPRSTEAPTEANATRDAAILHDAMNNLGTDEGRVFDVLSTASFDQIKQIAQVYETNYGKSLRDAIKDDFNSGEGPLTALLDQAGVE